MRSPEKGARAAMGLCVTCRFGRVFRSAKGVTYVSCERSKLDTRYPKFPATPVVKCPGFEERSEESPRNPNDRG